MSDHTFKPFDHELEALGRRVAEMGGVAEKMLADAMDGLFTFDVDMARRTVARTRFLILCVEVSKRARL